MARIRTIKPEIWTSEQFVDCTDPARLLFIGLWNFCDDHGVHQASLRRVKMEVFPGDDRTAEQIGAFVEELLDKGLLGEFTGDDHRGYWYVTGWAKHQRIDKPTYRFPAPPEHHHGVGQFDEPSPSAPRAIDESSTSAPPRKGRDVEGNKKHRSKEFDHYWSEVPNKVKKKDAQQVWASRNLDDHAAEIIADVKKRKATDHRWLDGFVPDPPTYLRGERWADEIITRPANGHNGGTSLSDDQLYEECRALGIVTQGKRRAELETNLRAAGQAR